MEQLKSYEIRKKEFLGRIQEILEKDFFHLFGFDFDKKQLYERELFELFWDDFKEKNLKEFLSNLDFRVKKAVDDFVNSGDFKRICDELGYKVIIKEHNEVKDVYNDRPLLYKVKVRRDLMCYIFSNKLFDKSEVEVYIENFDVFKKGWEPYDYWVLYLRFWDKGKYKITI